MAMNSPVSMAKPHEALQHTTNTKASGPDSFPAEFNKEFWLVLVPTYYIMVIQIKVICTLPTHINYTSSSLLLKPNTDHTLQYISLFLKPCPCVVRVEHGCVIFLGCVRPLLSCGIPAQGVSGPFQCLVGPWAQPGLQHARFQRLLAPVMVGVCLGSVLSGGCWLLSLCRPGPGMHAQWLFAPPHQRLACGLRSSTSGRLLGALAVHVPACL